MASALVPVSAECSNAARKGARRKLSLDEKEAELDRRAAELRNKRGERYIIKTMKDHPWSIEHFVRVAKNLGFDEMQGESKLLKSSQAEYHESRKKSEAGEQLALEARSRGRAGAAHHADQRY